MAPLIVFEGRKDLPFPLVRCSLRRDVFGFLNVFRIGKRWICFLRFIKELVAEVFIQKNLRDDLILTGRATQAKVGTDGFEIVDHPLGANGDIFNLHYSGLICRKKQGLGKPALITLNYPSNAKLIRPKEAGENLSG